MFAGRVNVYEKIKPTCNFLTRFVLVEKLASALDLAGPYVILCGFLFKVEICPLLGIIF